MTIENIKYIDAQGLLATLFGKEREKSPDIRKSDWKTMEERKISVIILFFL